MHKSDYLQQLVEVRITEWNERVFKEMVQQKEG